MYLHRVIPFLLFFLFLSFPVAAQADDSQDAEKPQSQIDFFIIPILEIVFSGNLQWRPYWPADIPPDGFSLSNGKTPAHLELSNTAENFIVKRDNEGRLVEFPFFMSNGYAKVKAAYSAAGALLDLSASLITNGPVKEDDAGQSGGNQADEKIWNIEFPAGFFPYSNLSPGGTFPSATINSGDMFFHVFFFESPVFFSETWYDSEGIMISFCKALVSRKNTAWRISSLQIHDAEGMRFEDFHFDSGGNVTNVRFQDSEFSALYRNGRPSYWQCPDLLYELQWDTQGMLTNIKTTGETEDSNVEYRYGYDRDASGNWIKRQETALKSRFDLLTPQPSYSRGIWTRRIIFSETGNGGIPSVEN